MKGLIEMKKSFPAVFSKEKDGYSVIFPDFSGATDGDNFEEAMSNAKEFLDSILAYYIDEQLSIPTPTDIEKIELNPHEIVTFIQGDPSRYIQQRTVRKSVTIPQWLASKGEKDNVNFSKILTDELFKKYG